MHTETKNCQNCKQDFTIEPDDFSFYEKMGVPAPSWCPECRLVRRLIWRNERALYKVSCALCNKNTFSMYAADKGFTVYCPECYRSDRWDPLSYGREYDFSRPFFTQWHDLFVATPKQGVHQSNAQNADFSNYSHDSKDVYLSYSTVYGSEYIYYSKNSDTSRYLVDCEDMTNSEYCHGCIVGNKNYRVTFSHYCRECIGCHFVYDCTNCQDCILSTNLRNKRYVIENIQYTKETYETKKKELALFTREGQRRAIEKYKALERNAIHKWSRILNSPNSSGNDIRDSKNIYSGFTVVECEDCKYIFRAPKCRDCFDATHIGTTELIYEYTGGGAQNSRMIRLSIDSIGAVDDMWYSHLSAQGKNYFGCASLRGAEYCILNQQYEKEEYYTLVEKIKKHMDAMPYIDASGRIYTFGEFFPPEFSPYAYNETVVQEYFPLTEQHALERGFSWRQKEQKLHEPSISTDDIPNSILDIDTSITKETIACDHGGTCEHLCTKAFRVIPEEVLFYKDLGLPIPSLCPNCRHSEREASRNPMRLWHRHCMCDNKNHQHQGVCPNEFETSYAPERPEKLYCEQCYQQEVL